MCWEGGALSLFFIYYSLSNNFSLHTHCNENECVVVLLPGRWWKLMTVHAGRTPHTPAGCYKEWTVLRTGLICFFFIVFQLTPKSLNAALLYALLLLLWTLSSLPPDSAGQRGAWRVWGAWGAWARKGRSGERLVHCSKTMVIYLPSLFESSHQHACGPGKVFAQGS